MNMIKILQITQLVKQVTSVKDLQQRICENLKGIGYEF